MEVVENENLTKLVLNINDENAKELLAELEFHAGNTKTLTYLHISGIPFANRGDWFELINLLLKKNPGIINLNLGNNNLTDEEFLNLKPGLVACAKVQALVLDRNKFTVTTFANLCRLLKTDYSLNSLILGGNNLADIGEYFADIQTMSQNKALASLSLSGNPLTLADLQALLVWQQQAAKNNAPQIRNLFLSGTGLTAEHMPCLLGLLALPHLISLNIDDNQLLDVDIQKIAKALAQNGSLSQLNIASNNFTEAGLTSLLAVVNSDNAPNTAGRRKLQRILKKFACEYHFQIAAQYMQQQQYTDAIAQYNKVINYDKDYLLAWLGFYQAKLDSLLMQDPIPAKALTDNYFSLQQGWKKLNDDQEYNISPLAQILRVNTRQMQKLIQARFNAIQHMCYFPIWQAIKEKNVEKLMQLINMQGYDINLPDIEGMTPLHFAAKINDMKIIQILLSAGAKAHLTAGQEKEYAWQLAKAGSQEQKTLREMQLMHHTEYARKHSVIRFLFPKLSLDVEMPAEDRRRILEKLKSIAGALNLLQQSYERAVAANPEKIDALQAYMATYGDIYSPITTGANLPAVYKMDVYELKKLEDTLISECNQLALSSKPVDVHLLGFYNQVSKLIADLLQLRELNSAILNAVHEFYCEHVMETEHKSSFSM